MYDILRRSILFINKFKTMEKDTSPVPETIKHSTKEKTMDFPEAIEMLIDGEKITRLEWGDQKVYGVKKDGFLMLHKDDDKFYNWVVNDGDLEATDWITI